MFPVKREGLTMLEQKVDLVEAAKELRRGMFIFIKGYARHETKRVDGADKVVYGEVADVTLHADANYERTHQRSLERLGQIELGQHPAKHCHAIRQRRPRVDEDHARAVQTAQPPLHRQVPEQPWIKWLTTHRDPEALQKRLELLVELGKIQQRPRRTDRTSPM